MPATLRQPSDNQRNSEYSRDHSEKVYREVVARLFAAMDPAPKVNMVRLGIGTHGYEKPEEGLPMGRVPSVTSMWHDAIMDGYYMEKLYRKNTTFGNTRMRVIVRFFLGRSRTHQAFPPIR